ncbi:YkvA family protein [Hymenobacter humi]|uniref:YkvA family protein n=1 Tax=Hymenobacter humi TaxID=1411620 RepID=A0ABW2U6K6_9BACT
MSSLTDQGLKISKNILFNVFVGRAAKLLGKPFKVVTILNETADKLADKESKTNKFQQLFEIALTLVRMVRSYISGEYREVPTSTMVSGLAVLLYILSPLDLVPDFIPVVGFLDDLSLVGWFVSKFSGEITKYREWEKTGRGQAITVDSAPARPDAAAQPARGDAAQPSVSELGHS